MLRLLHKINQHAVAHTSTTHMRSHHTDMSQQHVAASKTLAVPPACSPVNCLHQRISAPLNSAQLNH
jgi:hypothetical protein